MNEFDHVYVGYFFDVEANQTFCEKTFNYKLAELWKNLSSHVATEIVAFKIPEQAIVAGFEGDSPPPTFVEENENAAETNW